MDALVHFLAALAHTDAAESLDESVRALQTQLQQSPALFLARWGPNIPSHLLTCFEQHASADKEVAQMLVEIRRLREPAPRPAVIRNRSVVTKLTKHS